jgi:hypothetical protein
MTVRAWPAAWRKQPIQAEQHLAVDVSDDDVVFELQWPLQTRGQKDHPRWVSMLASIPFAVFVVFWMSGGLAGMSDAMLAAVFFAVAVGAALILELAFGPRLRRFFYGEPTEIVIVTASHLLLAPADPLRIGLAWGGSLRTHTKPLERGALSPFILAPAGPRSCLYVDHGRGRLYIGDGLEDLERG